MSCFVIGDIHGCLEEMACLIENLPKKPGDRLVFLGDYVDRGQDSRGVLSYLIDLNEASNYELIFLKGNHEDMLLSFLGFQGKYGDMYLRNGGKATLDSYSVSSGNANPSELRAKMPENHLTFLKSLNTYYLAEPFLCVHAGINPLKKMDKQTPEEMMWIRHEFIRNRHFFPYIVLFGHTPHMQVFYDLPYKIGLDTGLVYGNRLSCLETQEKTLFQIRKGERTISQEKVLINWPEI